MNKMPKLVELRYWYGAWQRGVSHQAREFQNKDNGHCLRGAPGGRVGSARRWRSYKAFV